MQHRLDDFIQEHGLDKALSLKAAEKQVNQVNFAISSSFGKIT